MVGGLLKNSRAVAGSALAALSVTIVLLAVAAPAGAAPVATMRGRLGPIEDRLQIGRTEEQSTNWSGYAAHGQTFTEVQGSWVQPTATCALKGRQIALAAFWVGLDGYGNRTVEQTGTEADCEGTRPIYYAWYELYPARPVLLEEPVAPGDVLHGTVTQGTLALEDRTAGWTYTQAFPTAGLEFSSAEWIAEAPFNRLTDFGSVRFSGASASTAAATGPISAWEADSIALAGNRGRNATILAAPGGLEAGGSAFTISAP